MICLIVTTLIIILSPPTVAVIRSVNAVADEAAESENNKSRAEERSPPHHHESIGHYDDDRMEQARQKQQHRQQQQFGTNDSSFLSSITATLLDWRGGIFATYETEDRIDNGQLLEDGATSVASSTSSRRKLRSRRTKDRTRTKRLRGDRADQKEHWCELVQSLNQGYSLSLSHTHALSLFALSISHTNTDVDWSTNGCVQSCNPTPKNPNCAGVARWDDIQFDTAEYCCSITFFWLSFQECTGAKYESTRSNDMTSLSSSSSSSSSGGGGMACSPEYSQFNGYRSRDTVTIYDSPNTGRVYQCKDDAMSLYCDQFPPNYSRVAPGGGSVDTVELGWTLLGDCQGKTPGSRGGDGGSRTSGQLPFDSTLKGDENDEASCWRSGRLCDSQAGRFACCTFCRNGVCA